MIKRVCGGIEESDYITMINVFGTVYEGIKSSVESFNILAGYALDKTIGLFTKQQLIALSDMMNGVIFEPALANKFAFVSEIRESERFRKTFSKRGVDHNAILDIVNQMSEYEVFFLMFEMYRFWKSADVPDENLLFELYEAK